MGEIGSGLWAEAYEASALKVCGLVVCEFAGDGFYLPSITTGIVRALGFHGPSTAPAQLQALVRDPRKNAHNVWCTSAWVMRVAASKVL